MKQEDFEKAVKEKIGNNVVGVFMGLLIMLFGYTLYNHPPKYILIVLLLIIMGNIISVFSFLSIIDNIESKHHPEKCDLCKRCKCLIKKDKIFCDDCRDRIRRLNKYEEDKKFVNEYKELKKREEKNHK